MRSWLLRSLRDTGVTHPWVTTTFAVVRTLPLVSSGQRIKGFLIYLTAVEDAEGREAHPHTERKISESSSLVWAGVLSQVKGVFSQA